MTWPATADQRVTAQSGLTRYIEEIRRVPMLEPHEEYMLAKRWREHDDLEAVHKLVNRHLSGVRSGFSRAADHERARLSLRRVASEN